MHVTLGKLFSVRSLLCGLFVFTTGCSLDIQISSLLLPESQLPLTPPENPSKLFLGKMSNAQDQPFFAKIAFDSEGHLYASSPLEPRVLKFDQTGAFVGYVGNFGTGPGKFKAASHIQVDKHDALYIYDGIELTLQKFSPNGVYESGFSLASAIKLFSISSTGKIFAIEGNTIHIYSNSGDLLSSFGSFGTNPGQFNNPTDIFITADDTVYISDRINDRIQKFDIDGNFISTWGTSGTNPGEIRRPDHIVVDENENILIIDYTRRIQKFSSSGVFIESTDLAANYYVKDININQQNEIILASSIELSYINPDLSIQTFKASPNNDPQPGVLYTPGGVATDQQQNIYIVENASKQIQKYSPLGQFIMSFGSEGSGDGQFLSPSNLTIDKSGNVYVTDDQQNNVQVFKSDGEFIRQIALTGMPAGVAVNDSGEIYVTDMSNTKIVKFSADGTLLDEFGDSILNFPVGITLSSDGKIIVCDANDKDLKFFSQAGEYLQSISTGSPGLPYGVTTDTENGDIFVTIYDFVTMDHSVKHFDTDGTLFATIKGPPELDNYIYPLGGIWMGADRNLLISDLRGGVFKLNTQGQLVKF